MRGTFWEIKTKNLIIITLLMTACLAPTYCFATFSRTVQSEIDPELLRIDEIKYLGAPVDTDLRLIDKEGEKFLLKDMLKGKPLILLLSYYRCDGVCPTVNKDFRTIVQKMKKKKLGLDFRVLSLSFDIDDNIERLKMFNNKIKYPKWMDKGWKTALFENTEDIKPLTESVGYRFFWSLRDKMFLHPNVFIFISPDGRVMRYLYGATIGSQDVELAINEAAFGKSGRSKVEDLKDLVLLACFSYNYKEGKYSINYPLFIAIGSLSLGVSSILIGLIVARKKVRR